jgi:two-component system CheB/CheR fusion protein
LKYTQQGGVLIGWGTNPGLNEWWVRITDTGPGLGEKTTRRLLDETDIPDQATVVSTSSGEGIGLLIVKRLCLLLGARISLDKPESKGTVITIHIPLIEPN